MLALKTSCNFNQISLIKLNFLVIMDTFNNDDQVPPTADRVGMSKQDAANLNHSQPSTSLEMDGSFALSSNSVKSSEQSQDAQMFCENDEMMDEEDDEAMEPLNNPSTSSVSKPVRQQAFSFSKIQVMGGPSSASMKESPAVKIASFAKASTVDRLAPTAASSLGSPSIPSRFIPQNSSVGSKQPITQTSLPTPALNSALRSFFNYAPQSDASPSTEASHSEEEDEDDDNENIEEEEILVYMQFDSKLDSDLLQPHTPFKMIGVDSEKPVLQLGNQVFEGNWKDTIGTAVFFEEHPSASSGDPIFTKNPSSTLHYHSQTQKALVMSRIFVKPKEEDEDGAGMVPMAIVEVP